MPPNSEIITKENLRAIAGEEWRKILQEEIGDDAPATLGDIRRMVRDALRENPALPESAAPVKLSQSDIDAIARRVAVILRDSRPSVAA